VQVQVASLLKERNAMLGAIAHDIKTYVQRKKLRLDLLDNPNQVEKAARDLDAMNKLEDALLVAVHANPLKDKETVDLFAVVSHEVEAARLAGGEVVLHRLGSGPFLVSGDRSALSRALSNIIGNALGYRREACVWVQRTGGLVEVIIDDDGPGIPRADDRPCSRPVIVPNRPATVQPAGQLPWACHGAQDHCAAARRHDRDRRCTERWRQTEVVRALQNERRSRSHSTIVIRPAGALGSASARGGKAAAAFRKNHANSLGLTMSGERWA
jgi:hypothetical protein